jgi:hypothetical protein
MILYVKFLRIEGKLPWGPYPNSSSDGRKYVETYFYDTTRLIDYTEYGRDFIAILRVETTESEARAQYLADYQAGRFRSSWTGAKVFDNPQEMEAEYGSFKVSR